MKYILLCVIAFAICLGCGCIPAFWIRKKKQLKKGITILLIVFFSMILAAVVTLSYLSIYYHADCEDNVIPPSVQVEKIDGGYFFDGPGKEDALIFYPGAKVETYAYASLLVSLAEKGVDCFLADMPFRMAMFGSNYGEKFLERYEYDTWACAGHSMGGLVISKFAASHASQVDTLILLASYPGSQIPDKIQFCSVYGDQDGCLNLEAYEKAKIFWPKNSKELVLEGGNHAQYAAYGPQSGDGEATITRKEQQDLTVNEILKVLKE